MRTVPADIAVAVNCFDSDAMSMSASFAAYASSDMALLPMPDLIDALLIESPKSIACFAAEARP